MLRVPRWMPMLLLLAVLCPTPAAAGGALYRYIDEKGVIHFTDTPSDPRFKPIPKRAPRRGYVYAGYSRGAGAGRARAWNATLYDELISDAAREHRLPPALVKAVIACESSFNPRAVSSKGALGLMQLMPSTADMLGVADPLHPHENVSGGARYLRALVDRYGDVVYALAAYNAGPQAVDRYGGIPPYRETQEYVRRVLTYYRQYHGESRR